jgi:PD-(D/E)XK nuclease superfamily
MKADKTHATTDIEVSLREMFEENFKRLRAESGHSLSPDVRALAWQQVVLYWRRLREIAESITDTEVRLTLPCQKTPKDRPFTIEGVVDIIREADRTTMYDIKTHDVDFVRANPALYEKQLNVYAYIWKQLRGERLDEMAVICTPIPRRVRDALSHGNEKELKRAMREWDPVVPIAFDPSSVDATIREFGEVVDAIEEGQFSPRSVKELGQIQAKKSFGRRICQNCDARFSCKSYREYAKALRGKETTDSLPFFASLVDEDDREGWREAAIPDAQSPDELAQDL